MDDNITITKMALYNLIRFDIDEKQQVDDAPPALDDEQCFLRIFFKNNFYTISIHANNAHRLS